jgi:putative membrane protein
VIPEPPPAPVAADGTAPATIHRPVVAVAGGRAVVALGAGPPWNRLHPLSPLVRAGRSLLALSVPLIVNVATSSRSPGAVRLDVVVVVVVAAVGVVSWAVTRWRIEDDVLRIDSGLLRRTSTRLPLAQVQAIDVVAPALARLTGLAEIRLRTAGSGGRAGRLAYLRRPDAETLRAHLLAVAHGVAVDTPASDERILASVPTGRLVASILLGRTGLACETVIVALVVLAGPDPRLAAVAASGGLTAFVGLLTSLWRQLNSDYGLTVAEAGDGLRLRAGLLQTTAETIPIARVQGLRLSQPLVWRALGWARLEVAVAGGERRGREGEADGRARRAVLPVARLADAESMAARLLPGGPVVLTPPPVRARWKTPLRYANLSWGTDGRYAVTTSGRLRRVTDRVPLAKVQSIRLVEGPVQRALGLGTVHLDIAGRSLHAALRDRDRLECDHVMASLPARCRAARDDVRPGRAA